MISREQVQDLRAGDVVELSSSSYPDVIVRGPVRDVVGDGALYLGNVPIRLSGGDLAFPPDRADRLTVIERALRPLYVNHDRTEPVPGDVVRFECVDHPDDSYTNVYLPRDGHDLQPWLSLTHDPGYRYSDDNARCDHLAGWTTRLLVDGETGQVVP